MTKFHKESKLTFKTQNMEQYQHLKKILFWSLLTCLFELHMMTMQMFIQLISDSFFVPKIFVNPSKIYVCNITPNQMIKAVKHCIDSCNYDQHFTIYAKNHSIIINDSKIPHVHKCIVYHLPFQYEKLQFEVSIPMMSKKKQGVLLSIEKPSRLFSIGDSIISKKNTQNFIAVTMTKKNNEQRYIVLEYLKEETIEPNGHIHYYIEKNPVIINETKEESGLFIYQVFGLFVRAIITAFHFVAYKNWVL